MKIKFDRNNCFLPYFNLKPLKSSRMKLIIKYEYIITQIEIFVKTRAKVGRGDKKCRLLGS